MTPGRRSSPRRSRACARARVLDPCVGAGGLLSLARRDARRRRPRRRGRRPRPRPHANLLHYGLAARCGRRAGGDCRDEVVAAAAQRAEGRAGAILADPPYGKRGGMAQRGRYWPRPRAPGAADVLDRHGVDLAGADAERMARAASLARRATLPRCARASTERDAVLVAPRRRRAHARRSRRDDAAAAAPDSAPPLCDAAARTPARERVPRATSRNFDVALWRARADDELPVACLSSRTAGAPYWTPPGLIAAALQWRFWAVQARFERRLSRLGLRIPYRAAAACLCGARARLLGSSSEFAGAKPRCLFGEVRRRTAARRSSRALPRPVPLLDRFSALGTFSRSLAPSLCTRSARRRRRRSRAAWRPRRA